MYRALKQAITVENSMCKQLQVVFKLSLIPQYTRNVNRETQVLVIVRFMILYLRQNETFRIISKIQTAVAD